MPTYKARWAQTHRELAECFEKWGVVHWRVSTQATRTQLDSTYLPKDLKAVGLEYTDHRTGRPIVLEVDAQDSPAANLRVLFYAVDALRLNELRGLDQAIQTAYLQLSAPPSERDPHEVLGVRPDSPDEVIDAAYKALAKRHHPDTGGDADAAREVNRAYERIQEARKARAT